MRLFIQVQSVSLKVKNLIPHHFAQRAFEIRYPLDFTVALQSGSLLLAGLRLKLQTYYIQHNLIWFLLW